MFSLKAFVAQFLFKRHKQKHEKRSFASLNCKKQKKTDAAKVCKFIISRLVMLFSAAAAAAAHQIHSLLANISILAKM
mgnify:CR=1 FL=1